MYTTVIDHRGSWFMRKADIEDYEHTFGQRFIEDNGSAKTIFVDPIVSNARTILSVNPNLRQVRSADNADLIVIPTTIPRSNRSIWGRRWGQHVDDGTIVGFKYNEDSPSSFVSFDEYYDRLESVTKDAYDFIFSRLPTYDETKLISIQGLINFNESSSNNLDTVECYLTSDDLATVILGTTMLLQMRFDNMFPIITLFSKCGKHIKKTLGDKQTQHAKLLETIFPKYSSMNAYNHFSYLSTYSETEVESASEQIIDLLKRDLLAIIKSTNPEFERIICGNKFTVDMRIDFTTQCYKQIKLAASDFGKPFNIDLMLPQVLSSTQYTQSIYILGLLYPHLDLDMQKRARAFIQDSITQRLSSVCNKELFQKIKLTIIDNNVHKSNQ